MRIAILMTSIAGGGSERFATVLANGLATREHEVHLLTGPTRPGEYCLFNQVHRTVLYTKSSLVKNALSLRTYLKKHHIDVCVAVGIYPNFVAALSNFNLETHIVLSERNAPKEDFLSRKTRILRKLLYWRGDAFVFQTPDAKAFYSRNIQNRGVVIPNPIKDNLSVRLTDSPLHEIVAVGRLMPQKNYPMLLDAFALVVKKHPEYSLRIFGRGKYETELKFHTSLSGPHRDKFIITDTNGLFTAKASTGQLRLVSLLLKTAQAYYYRQLTDCNPVYLIDDVLLELDIQTRAAYLNLINYYSQAFYTFLYTCTHC